MALQIHTAPSTSKGEVVLGKTLAQMLDDAVEKYPNPKAFNMPDGNGWRSTSNADFQTAANEIAVGLLEAGIERGDRVSFFMDSDLYFQMMDFGTLIGGMVNVPLYTTYAPENLVYVAAHAEAKAIAITNREMLENYTGWADQLPDVTLVILAEGSFEGVSLPEAQTTMTLDELRASGRAAIEAAPNRPDELRDQIDASDLATLIYTSGTTGKPKGVMLSHENITSNAITAISGFGVLGHQEETVLNFLPMTHIYARTLTLANAGYGHTLFYSNPDRLVEDLPKVRPTFFATVPRVLEKVFDKVSLGIQEAEGAKKKIGSWALGRAVEFDVASPPSGLDGIAHGIADKLVYSKLREKLGLTRIKAVTSGGAALRADLARAFSGFGIPVYEGYGLTETSPVIANNIPGSNQPGTVGPPIAGVEVAIAEDGEILSRGPNTMQGYYKAQDKTDEVIDGDGWFHTGDIGEFTPAGFLKITDRKKALFKLSTGKYVIPQPIENALTESPLIEQAVVVGNSQKFTTALIFPNMESLPVWAKNNGVSASGDALLKDAKVHAEFERLVADANQGMDHWSQVQRFRLVPETMTVENELLTPTMKVKRGAVNKTYDDQIDAMYKASVEKSSHGVSVVA
ncbi:AMP-dependent synthetase/ligase [Rubrivirga sp.]|uniref:AMP-dependent synthetase/ligase n=1 Tax=Rubrivirga sp. TaxID=1885344 RepID=UPI003C75E7C9